MNLLPPFFVTFIYVFLRATQQLNVVKGKYLWVIPVSYLMAFADVFLIVTISRAGVVIPLILSIGTGGALGAILAMKIHKRFA